MDYFDHINPGMKEFLKEVEVEKDLVDGSWARARESMYTTKVTEDDTQVWRALKNLTSGEARKVVTTVKGENGFRAWQKLHMRFGPSLASKQGMVLMDFSGMVARPAKTTEETRNLITEMERKIKMVEDVTGEEVSENHAKSVLVGILDPTTRQHTAMYHGSNATCEQLKKVVLEFTNNVARGPSPMQIGGLNQQENPESMQNSLDTEQEQFVGAFGKGTQCYACGEYGHIAKGCPHKGKGKGKGQEAKGKGFDRDGYKGKGKGKFGGMNFGKGQGKKGPMFGTCWICGGNHFMANCQMKGKGKGLNQLCDDTHDYYWDSGVWPEEVRSLSSIQIVASDVQKAQCPDSIDDHEGIYCQTVPSNPWIAVRRRKVKFMHRDGIQRPQSPQLILGNRYVFEDDDVDADVQGDDEICGNQKIKEGREYDQHDGFDHQKIKARCGKCDHLGGWHHQKIKEEFYKDYYDVIQKYAQSNINALNIIQTIEPEAVNSVKVDNRWEIIDMAVDSGASETVIGEEMLQSVQTKEGDASRRGVQYEVANGVRIPNLGEKRFKGHTVEGMARNLTAQVCEVNKALLSVKRVVQAGNKVVFDADGSYIEDKSTGEKMWLREENGMYMLRMWVKTQGF